MNDRPAFQFRLRDLLLSMSFFAAALGAGLAFWREAALRRGGYIFPFTPYLLVLYAFIALVCVGAAIGSLFCCPVRGAVCGGIYAVFAWCLFCTGVS